MIVVDTNIIAHFWLPSDSTKISDLLYQKDSQWAAPILWQSEFRNVITLYLRKELIDLAEALRIIEKAELQMSNRQYPLIQFKFFTTLVNRLVHHTIVNLSV